jgi:hypothetical protein
VADAGLLLEVQARQQLGRPYGLPLPMQHGGMRAVADPWAVGSRRTTLDSQLLAAAMYADEAPAGGLAMGMGMYGGSRLQEAGLIPAERGGGGDVGYGVAAAGAGPGVVPGAGVAGRAARLGPMLSEGGIRVAAAAGGDGGQQAGGVRVPHSYTVAVRSVPHQYCAS